MVASLPPGPALAAAALLAATVAGAVAPGPAAADNPLSAIDWLTRTVDQPPTGGDGHGAPPPAGPVPEPRGAVPGLTLETITVTPLDAPTVDALGLLPAERAGLPRDLWGPTPSADLAARLAQLSPDTLPALQQLTLRLLLAELDPPGDAEGRGALFLARLDRLVAFGALDQALSLIEAAAPAEDPALFARWFDLALLAGDVAPACTALRGAPALAAGHPLEIAARAYCLARGGDWEEAEALLATPEAAHVPEAERTALKRFLDPEADHAPPPPPGTGRAPASPLLWHLLDTLGEAPPTATLPLAFAHADLGPTAGWKARIEAAERLTRAGVMTPNRLLGLYTERAPAASGGVWERVRVIQQLEAALLAENTERLADILPPAWAQMVEAELEVAFADLYAERLLRLELSDEAAALAYRAGLLTDAAAEVAARPGPAPRRAAFAATIAAGQLAPDSPRPSGAMAEAIALGLAEQPDPVLAARLADLGRGQALLEALALLQSGGSEDARAVAEALALLRAAGQEEVARRTAVQILLLDRRG